MSEQKTGTITLTVPWHEEPVARADGTLWDGRDRTGAAKDGRSIAVMRADIGKAMLAAWQGEAATDYAKRLAEIDARASAATRGPWPSEEGWHNGGAPSRTWKIPARQDGAEVEMLAEDALFVEHAREDVPWLLVQHRAASEALAALGIPDDGRSLAERVADLGKTLRGALHDAGLLRDMQGRKCHDDHAVATARREADILKRAARAAAIAGGEVVPEDAGPEAVASALRRATERTKVTASDLGDALREAEAELAARADPNGTWAKLEALAGKVAGIADEVDTQG
jgi:hypothetical protein